MSSITPNAETEPLLPRSSPPQPHGPLDISAHTRRGVLAGIWTATFLASMNTTLVATLMSTISSDYNRSTDASWLGTSFLLATCTFTPLYGRLSDALGRRLANQIAVSFCAIGTLACGLATSMNMLIMARFLAGIGGGGIFTTASIVISDMYSMRDRSLAQGLAAVFNGLGLGLGGPVGGYISDRFGWRWAFLSQLPFFFVSFALTSYYLNYSTAAAEGGKQPTLGEALMTIDWPGSAALLGAVASMLLFLSFRYNQERPWSSPSVIVTISGSIACFIAFVLVELFLSERPVLAQRLLNQKVPIIVAINNFLVAMCNFTITFSLPLWFETVDLTSAGLAGMHLVPNSVSMAAGSLFAGWAMHKTGKYKSLNMIFGILPAGGAVMIALLRYDSSAVAKWVSIIPLGFGNSVVLQTTLIALLASVPSDDMAVATGFGQLFRGIGQASGVAISAAIFQTKLDAELHARISGPFAPDLIHRIRHNTSLVHQLPADIRIPIVEAFASSLRVVFWFAAFCTLGAFIVRIPIPELSMDEEPGSEAASHMSDEERGSACEHEHRDDSSMHDETRHISRPAIRPKYRKFSTYESTH